MQNSHRQFQIIHYQALDSGNPLCEIVDIRDKYRNGPSVPTVDTTAYLAT